MFSRHSTTATAPSTRRPRTRRSAKQQEDDGEGDENDLNVSKLHNLDMNVTKPASKTKVKVATKSSTRNSCTNSSKGSTNNKSKSSSSTDDKNKSTKTDDKNKSRKTVPPKGSKNISSEKVIEQDKGSRTSGPIAKRARTRRGGSTNEDGKDANKKRLSG